MQIEMLWIDVILHGALGFVIALMSWGLVTNLIGIPGED